MVNLNKSSKKRGPQDFVKTKGKVGKIKPGAVNATNTTVVTKKLQVKEQQFSVDQKTCALVLSSGISKKMSLIKLYLSQTGHYNVNSRRDAFSNIFKKLKEDNWVEGMESLIGDLMISISKGMVDVEGSIRALVLSISTLLFSQIPQKCCPFFPQWLQFVLMGQSHLAEDVKRDSNRYLDMSIKYIPHLIKANAIKILLNMAEIRKREGQEGRRTTSRTKGPSSFEVACNILKLLTQTPSTGTLSEGSVVYTWKPEQKVSLYHLKIRKDDIIETVSAQKSELSRIIEWITVELIDDWLEAASLIGNPEKHSSSASEKDSLVKLKDIFKCLFILVSACGFEADLVRESCPRVMKNSDVFSLFVQNHLKI